MLTRSVELPLNPLIKTSQYLLKDKLSSIKLVIYLEIDLLEKFNLNLEYILIGVLNLDNQGNVLYKVFFS